MLNGWWQKWRGRLFSPEPSSQIAPPPSPPQHHVRRLHRRHGPFVGIVSFRHPSLGNVDIDNLSLGGLMLCTQPADVKPYLGEAGTLKGDLWVLDSSAQCELLPTNDLAAGVGCRLIHSDQSVVLLLRRYLMPYQSGEALRMTPESQFKFASSTSTLAFVAGGVHIHSKTSTFDFKVQLISGKSPQLDATSAQAPTLDEAVGMSLFLLLGFLHIHPEFHDVVSGLTYDLLARVGTPAQLQGAS